MKRSALAAPAADFPSNPSLLLPIEAPRHEWPELIECAASRLESGDAGAVSRSLALELRSIAQALRGDAAGVLVDALLECIEATQPVAQMHATENARAVLRRVGGVA